MKIENLYLVVFTPAPFYEYNDLPYYIIIKSQALSQRQCVVVAKPSSDSPWLPAACLVVAAFKKWLRGCVVVAGAAR